ncbi:MAG TPA: TetR/AcrR family transcriptional regulator [Gemmatimonadaceae bacterium]|nr:TetR/AcrR family transcriptional regulator [Gemmatimonadaceae bacterium]
MPSTVQHIASAARRLLDKDGAEAVTMRRVASAVGITPMAIYRHYADRSALLNELADAGFADLAARLTNARQAGSIEERLVRMAEIFLDHALQNPRLFELMFFERRAGARRFPRDFKTGRSPTANVWALTVREGMELGELRQDDPWEITFAMGALSHGLIALYLGGRLSASAARFRAFYRRSFRRYLRGLRP